MPTCPPSSPVQWLIDSLRGSYRFGIQAHPERFGWVRLTGRRDLAGVEVETTTRLLVSCGERWRRGVCEALLEAQKELVSLQRPVHLVNVPSGRTDCGLDAGAPGEKWTVPVTLSRAEANCPACLGEGAREERRAAIDRALHELVGRQVLEGKLLVSVDPAATSDGVVVHVDPAAAVQVLDVDVAVEVDTDVRALATNADDGQVDAFLLGIGEIARATRELAEAQRAVNGGGDSVEDLVDDVARKLRERVKRLDASNGQA